MSCKTFVCPDGHCFCKLSPIIRKAVYYEVLSIGTQPPGLSRRNHRWIRTQLSKYSESIEEWSAPRREKSNLEIAEGQIEACLRWETLNRDKLIEYLSKR